MSSTIMARLDEDQDPQDGSAERSRQKRRSCDQQVDHQTCRGDDQQNGPPVQCASPRRPVLASWRLCPRSIPCLAYASILPGHGV
jgi:hypothetical protein